MEKIFYLILKKVLYLVTVTTGDSYVTSLKRGLDFNALEMFISVLSDEAVYP